MRRVLLTVAMVAMLVLAGCNGGPSGTTTTAETTTTDGGTATQTDSGSTTESGSDIPSDLYPPGVDESGVYNRSGLVINHLQAIRGNAVETTTFERGGASVRIEITNGTDAESFRLVNDTTGRQTTWWRSGSTVVRRNTSQSPPITYGTGQTGLLSTYSFQSGFLRIFPYLYINASQYAVDGTATVDGQQALRLSVEGPAETGAGGRQGFNVMQNVTSLGGEVLVTPDGVIRSARFEIESENRERATTLTYEVSQVGSASAPRPDWASGHPSATVSTAADGNLLALTYESGDPIPAGTRVELASAFYSRGNLTLSESLDPGETLYVYYTGGLESEVGGQIGQQPTLPDDVESVTRSQLSLNIELEDVELQFGLPEGAGAGQQPAR